MSPERRRGSVFIGAVLLLQLALPISYYAEGRTFDERFAWRMFSPVRVTHCSVAWAEGASRRRVNVSADVHQVWYSLMKRARSGVVEGYAKRRCELLRARGDAVPEVYVQVRCQHPDGEVRDVFPPAKNWCAE